MQPRNSVEAIRSRHREIEGLHGKWTAHNIWLGDGLSTRGGASAEVQRVRRVLQVAADLTGRPLAELRVLDLGCLEGQFAVEFALQGAEVVAIEGREANIAKAELAKDALGLDRLELRREDVRSLHTETHGRFDLILCLGLLYHLDREDVFDFLRTLRAACTRVLVLDTHVALSGRSVHCDGEHEYHGIDFVEHSKRAPAEQRAASLWASLDNPRSFWPTLPSLVNALSDAGFTSVLECRLPVVETVGDRVTLVALAGDAMAPRSVPPGQDEPKRMPEAPPNGFIRNQSRAFMLAKRVVLWQRAIRRSGSSPRSG
jgi:SAM-dependent methyltransferase